MGAHLEMYWIGRVTLVCGQIRPGGGEAQITRVSAVEIVDVDPEVDHVVDTTVHRLHQVATDIDRGVVVQLHQDTVDVHVGRPPLRLTVALPSEERGFPRRTRESTIRS